MGRAGTSPESAMFCANGQDISLELVILFGVILLCSLGLFGLFCVMLVWLPDLRFVSIFGMPTGSAEMELGPSTRPLD